MSAADGRGDTLLISDVHTKYEVIERQIEHATELDGVAPQQVLVLGDFGFFGDELHDWFRRKGHRFSAPVACIEGNHEDHGALPDLAERYADCFTYLSRASIRPIGRLRGLCLGGARYMDAWSTPRGCEITAADLEACLGHASDDVDVILTHDCPAGIGVPNTRGLEHYGPPGVPGLDRLAEHFRPTLWFFGHHHRWFELERAGTRYCGLAQSWMGYVLLSPEGKIRRIDNEIPIAPRSRWRRWLGLR